jgi:mono/diheme cytochrome c family protein
MDRRLLVVLVAVLLLAAAGAALYRFALPGLSSARPAPPAIEMEVATWLLQHSVPPEAAARANPLKPDEANIAAGAVSFQQRCAVCHGFDGSGRTTIGEHVYPRAPFLRQALPSLTDGQIFTYINNGIRNTAMPAWDLPDDEIWQIVAFLRHLPPTAAPGSAKNATAPIAAGAHYVGSAACESCHNEIYASWRKTRMANVVRDPHEHPDAFIPDFSKPDPVLTFAKDDVAFRLRQPVEAALFHSPRRRLLPPAGAVGHHAFSLAALPCAEECRLVGAALS